MPGYTAFGIYSANKSLLAMSDTAREPWLFVRHPQWQPSYDMDGSAGRQNAHRHARPRRRRRHAFEAYHFPFPACHLIARIGSGFDLMPTMWQPL